MPLHPGTHTFESLVPMDAGARFPDGNGAYAGAVVRFGTSDDAVLLWSTTQTPDALHLGLGAESNALVISERDDLATDFGHALQTNPTIFLQSANAADVTEWLSLSYGVVATGKGDLALSPFSGLVTTTGKYRSGDGASASVSYGDAAGTSGVYFSFGDVVLVRGGTNRMYVSATQTTMLNNTLIHDCLVEHVASGFFNASSGVQVHHKSQRTIQQSGTAGYTMLQVNAIHNSLGSGAQKLADFQVGGTPVCTLDSAGALTLGAAPQSAKLVFGDGDTGLRELADDTLQVLISGFAQYGFSGDTFGGTDAAGPKFRNIAASATLPNIYPNFGDGGTGIGTAGVGALSLIGNGVEALRLDGNNLSASSGVATVGKMALTINQSGTAGYTGLLLEVTEASTGSGARNLILATVGGATRFAVNAANGNVTMGASPVSVTGLFNFAQQPLTLGDTSSGFYLQGSTTRTQAVITVGTSVGVHVVLGHSGLYTKDFDHTAQDNPTLFIHSATDPDSDNQQWLGLAHNTLWGQVCVPADQRVVISEGEPDVSTYPAMLNHRERVVADADGTNPSFLESRSVYTNEGAVGEAGFTLPSITKAGLTYTFVVQAAQNLRVTASAGDTIRIVTEVSAAAGNVVSNVVGSVVTLVAINTTEWVATTALGTWTVT